MKATIEAMLKEAYRKLGICDDKQVRRLSRTALEYFTRDRDHYIEVAEKDVPEYYITTKHGVICYLIPLAREITKDQAKDHVREHTRVYSLMISKDTVRYVFADSHVRIYPNPAQNTYSFPVYRYAQLKDIRPMKVCPPQELRPVATPQDREVMGMMFMAFAKLGTKMPVNYIPHKTERALLAAAYTSPEELTVDGRRVTGKLIPLAREDSMWEEMREDHRYGYQKELCLLISGSNPRYLIKTRHYYHYFRKVIYDDVPGGCAYEPTEEKQEVTYTFVTLDEIQPSMYPLYN